MVFWDGILGWYIESGRYTGGDIPTNKTRFIRIGGDKKARQYLDTFYQILSSYWEDHLGRELTDFLIHYLMYKYICDFTKLFFQTFDIINYIESVK